MKMRCRECNTIYDSKEIKEENRLVYVTDGDRRYDCINGSGFNASNPILDDSSEEVIGYDGCLGWP